MVLLALDLRRMVKISKDEIIKFSTGEEKSGMTFKYSSVQQKNLLNQQKQRELGFFNLSIVQNFVRCWT